MHHIQTVHELGLRHTHVVCTGGREGGTEGRECTDVSRDARRGTLHRAAAGCICNVGTYV